MSELDPLDRRLNMAWQALSPPDGLAARVRTRLASAGAGAAAATLGARVASRYRSLRASGPLGAIASALLLGVGVALGYLIPKAPAEAVRTPEPATTARSEAAAARALPPRVDDAIEPPGATPLAPHAPAASGASALAALDGPSAAPSGAVLAPGSPGEPAASRRELAAPPRARAHFARRAPAADADPGAELQLLERAERAVRSKHPALALALIAELEQRFPRSPLHEERRAIELMAHCQARGAGSETNADASSTAVAHLERFADRYPGSVYSARIAEECGAVRSPAALTNGAAPDMDGAEGDDDARHE